MKILIDLSYYFPHISGLSEYARRLAEGLKSDDVKVEVICNRQSLSSPKYEIISGVIVRRFDPSIKFKKISFSWELVTWCVQNMRQYDAIIINLPNPEGVIVALIGRMMGKKAVSVLHCEVATGKSITEGVISLISKASNIVCAIVSNKIVINAMDYAKSIGYLRLFPNKLTEIFPIVGLGPVEFKSKTIKRAEATLGYLGRMSEEKNLHTVIEAINKIKRYQISLRLAGPNRLPGEEDYFLKIDKMARDSGERVTIEGKLDEREIKHFFRKIDFFVLASNVSTESFGIVQVEAMRSGVPVIVSNMPGIRVPVLLTGAGVLVDDYNNPNDWVKKIELALDNEDKLKKLTLLSKRIFDPDKEMTKWKKLMNLI